MSPHEKPKPTTTPKLASHAGIDLGELLRKRRGELKLRLEQIEKATGIRQHYLEMIEASQYSKLADDVYTRGYVKNYAEFLGFDTKEIMKLYSGERHRQQADKTPQKNKSLMSLKPIDSQSFIFTPKSIVIILATSLVLVLFAYVGWQFSQLATPPKISLNNLDQSSVTTSFVIVSGEVDDGSDVLINDSPVLSTAEGSFSERVALLDGVNQIKVTAKNKFGKETSKTLLVTAKLSQATASAANNLSPTVFDGVELTVKITKQASWIIVTTDGQDAFRGTMLPGTQQTFKAKSVIKLTTGNAGSTNVTLTNAVEFQKDLGTLGRDREAKLDLVFNKDTDIQ